MALFDDFQVFRLILWLLPK